MTQPQVSDFLAFRGCIEVALKNAFTGEVIEKRKIDNTVVTAGRSWVLNELRSDGVTSQFIRDIAIGSVTTAPATGDTLLASEQSRKAIGTFTTTGLANNPPSWRAETSWATNEANTTLGEVGLFNTSSANAQTMLARATFATINKTTSNTLSISYTISN